MKYSASCFRYWVLLLALVCALGVFAFPVRAAEEGGAGTGQAQQGTQAGASGQPVPDQGGAASPSADDAMASVWSTRAEDLGVLIQDAAALQGRAESLGGPLAAQVKDTRMRFARLMTLFQASRGHPTELLTLVQQMRGLHSSLKKAVEPVDDIAASVSSRLEEVARIKADLDDLNKRNTADGIDLRAPAEAENEGLKAYSRALSQTQQKLKVASAGVEKILAPARATLARIETSVTEIDGSLMGIWESYYLNPSANTLDTVLSAPGLLADWAISLSSRVSFAYPQSMGEWAGALQTFLLTALALGALGWLGLRGARVLPDNWRQACEQVITGAWVRISLGWATLAASANQYGGIYFGFVLLGCLLLIAGLTSLIWRLRIAVVPALADKPSPLLRLYIPAAIGVLMLFSDLPARIMGVVWGLAMLVFVVRIHMRNRERGAGAGLPLLERLSYGCAFYLGTGSLLLAAAGYARLAILLFMFLFALVSTVILANALAALLQLLASRAYDKEEKPVRLAIAEALAIPAAWLLSLPFALPWIWAVPGARYILQKGLAANYTVGDASFDFSKVLIIGLLFFLFRAFVSLGKASLEHLPDRVPTIERGVIPPLRTMLTYAAWAVFFMIALSMLGVNFTSLAVVAGGLSVGIGFGMQNLFNNLVSGLMLTFGRTILVGDSVEVGSVQGTVRAIHIRSTTIETSERAMVFVPNSAIMAGHFVNWTRNNRTVRKSIQVGVAYGSDIALVEKLLLDAARSHPHVLNPPAPQVFFTNFGGSSLDFTLNIFIDDLDHAGRTLSDLRFAISTSFAENGIDIPFPQLTVHAASLESAGKTASPAGA